MWQMEVLVSPGLCAWRLDDKFHLLPLAPAFQRRVALPSATAASLTPHTCCCVSSVDSAHTTAWVQYRSFRWRGPMEKAAGGGAKEARRRAVGIAGHYTQEHSDHKI